MIAIGRYLLLIISLAGMTLAVDRFSKEGELYFNDAQKTRKVNWELCHYIYLKNYVSTY